MTPKKRPPTPWHYEKGKDRYGIFTDANVEKRPGDAFSKADAELIVRAVNAHEDMLLALEEVKSYLIKIGRQDARSYVEQITEAIAKAEGK